MAQLPFTFSGRPVPDAEAEKRDKPARPSARPAPRGRAPEPPAPEDDEPPHPAETWERAPADRPPAPVPPPAPRAPDRSERPIAEAAKAPPVYTVSELQTRLRMELEQRYLVVHVSGEISNYQLNARSGHAYFTLKDEGAQLKCVLFRDQGIRLRFKLGDGLQVVVRGKITVYEAGGQLQMVAQSVEPKGLGARQLELQQRLEKLRKEGLTADARKRKIPAIPRTIGVVTSKSGAALRDVLRTILRRDPYAHVIVSHTAVQGDGAAVEIAQAIRRLDALRAADVILVCRGGGSIEDLWCFNEEVVARAIVACSVPVITGVGHETDTTVADHVSDLRASTPTAAAEHAVPVRSELRARLQKLAAALHRALLLRTGREGRRLVQLSARLKHPEAMLERRAQRIDELGTRGERALRRRLGRATDRLSKLERRLARRDPMAELQAVRHRLAQLEGRLERAARRPVDRGQRALAVLAGQLESLSPLKVLARGYALVERAPGALVRSATEVEVGDTIDVRLAEGRISATVTTTSPAHDGAPNETNENRERTS